MKQLLTLLYKQSLLLLLPLLLAVNVTHVSAQTQAPLPGEYVLLISSPAMKQDVNQSGEYARMKKTLGTTYKEDLAGYSDKTISFMLLTRTTQKAKAKERIREVQKLLPGAEVRLTTVAEMQKIN